MDTFDFSSEIPDDLPITKRAVDTVKAAGPTADPVSTALLNAVAELESYVNRMEFRRE